MTAIIFIGIQATGKTTLYKDKFLNTHIRLSLDMLKTRNREMHFLQTCITAKQSFVVDNTNASIGERARYIKPARTVGFRVIGYYFQSLLQDSLVRNRLRQGRERIPDKGVMGAAGRLELPSLAEGFDELWYVRIDGEGGFVIEPWRNVVDRPE